MEKQRKPITIIIKEIFLGLLGFLLGDIWNKIGLSVFLIVFSAILFFSKVNDQNGVEQEKPIIFNVTAIILLLMSVYLIYKRYKELQNRENK